jgi:hypothetical protein
MDWYLLRMRTVGTRSLHPWRRGIFGVAYADRGDTFPPSMEARYLWRDAVLGVRAELQAAPLTLNIHHLNE